MGESMQNRIWGTIGLGCEVICLVLFVLCFLVFRFDLPHPSIFAFDGPLPRWCVRIVLLSVVPAICGLFADRLKERSIGTLVVWFPELIITGILKGHW